MNLDIYEELAKCTIELLSKRGEFLIDTNTESIYYFWDDESKLIYLGNDNAELTSLLNLHLGLNPADKPYRVTVQYLRDFVFKHGKGMQAHSFSFYEESSGKLYLDSNSGDMWVLDGTEIMSLRNGKDGVYFLPTSAPEPVTFDQAACTCTALQNYVFNVPNIKPGGLLTESESRFLLQVCFLALFFGDIQPTKAMLLLVGPKDSGKSTYMRCVGKLLRGDAFEIGGVPKTKQDAQVVADNERFVFWDNADTFERWLPDFLATGASGVEVGERKFFTNKEKLTLSVNPFFWLNSRTPKFKRDDVLDRTVPIFTETRAIKEPENDIYSNLAIHRAHLWGHVVNLLQGVIQELHSGQQSKSTPLRMADFYYVGGCIARALGRGEEWDRIVDKVRRVQSALLYADEPLLDILRQWAEIPENHERLITAAELHKELVASDPGVNLYCLNGIVLGRKLTQMQETLEHCGIKFNVLPDNHTKINKYTFDAARGAGGINDKLN